MTNPTTNYDCCKGGNHHMPWCFEAVKVPGAVTAATSDSDSTHQPAVRGGGDEQSQLFPRYSFAVVTGRYKVLDNRSDGPVRITQIATADGEDKARLIIQALNQHQSLVAERVEQAQALTRDWNQKTRVEQIIARHQVWDISSLPNEEYTASFADVKQLLNERERLRETLRAALNSLSRTVCKNYPNYPEEQMQISPTMTVADARAALNNATPNTSAGEGEG